jgi:Domain of unknown function (DUF4296)
MRRMPFLLAFFYMTACTNPGHVPRGILSKDSMEKILWDIIQADQFSTQYLAKDSAKINLKSETMKLYEEVFRLHHISKTDFDKSYQFYLDHPDITTVMFDSLSAKANRQHSEVFKKPVKIPAK